MQNELTYGERVALELIKRRRTQPVKEKGVKKRSKSAPELDIYPMGGYEYKHTQDQINWSENAVAEGLAKHVQNSSCNMSMLVLPTGAGKTSAAVAAIAKLDRPFMVVCPPSVLKGCGWQETISSYNQANPDKPLNPFMITSFDRFSNILDHVKVRTNFKKMFPKDGIIIIDEVHNYKNPTSKRSKKMQTITEYYRLGLTATPLTNDQVSDTCSYLVMAGFYTSKTNFMNVTGLYQFVDKFHRLMIYDITGRVNTTLWGEYKNVRKQLSEVIYSPTYTVKSEDFPALDTTTITVTGDVDLQGDLNSITRAYQNRQFESAIDVANAMMARICNSKNRLEQVKEIVSKEGVRQPLIFFFHTATRDALLDMFPTAQIVDGSHHMDKIDLNKTDAPILVQYRSGSEGVEFKNSNCSVFYENQYSYISLKQAIGRNVRRGQTEPVHHYLLVSDATFDQEVFSRLSQKEEINNEELERIVEDSIQKAASW